MYLSNVMSGKRKKIGLVTFGCRANQYDTALTASNLNTFAETVEDYSHDVDLVIINTCTVTHKPERNLRKLIRRINRETPGKPIIVMGCQAELQKEELKKLKGVTRVFGVRDRSGVTHAAAEILGITTDPHAVSQTRLLRSFGRTRPNIKIQEGCNHFCTYCAVPYARGKPWSRDKKEIVEEINTLTQTGVREIVLTGINIGSYGRDLENKSSLAELIKTISTETDIVRIRIASIEPMEITDALIGEMAQNKKICAHLHLPLQSGSEMVLKDMRRPYTKNEFSDLIVKLHSAIPNFALGMDVIVGFPTEGDNEFKEGYEFVSSLEFAYLHVFNFSPRPGTKAAQLKQKSLSEEIKERSHQLISLSKERHKIFTERNLNSVQRVIIEFGKGKRNAVSYGVTDNYLTVYFNEKLEPQSVVSARLNKIIGGTLFGIPL